MSKSEYHCSMQVVTGTVIGGKVVLDGSFLPDGTPVTVFVQRDETILRLPPQLQAELESALDEADRLEGASAEELFAELKKFG